MALLAGFLAVMTKTAIDRDSDQKLRARVNENQGGDSTQFANAIAGNARAGYRPVDPPTPPVVPIARAALDAPPAPPKGTGNAPPPRIVQRDEEATKIRAMKMSQFLNATRAATAVDFTDKTHRTTTEASAAPQGRQRSLPPDPAALEAMFNARRRDAAAGRAPTMNLAAGPTGTGRPVGGAMGMGPGMSAPGYGNMGMDRSELSLPRSVHGGLEQDYESRANFDQWENRSGGDRWALKQFPQNPRTDFELRAGTVIPAVLISGILSDLVGPIIAQVSQNVYDTPTGRHLLIPQGSKLFGRYSNEIAMGQSRVLVGWQRITFPDGRALDIGSMPGADEAGYAGFEDQVNNHYWRIFGNALLLSAITGGVTISQSSYRRNNNPSAGDVMSQQMGAVLGQTVAQIISKNINISPTIEIRPGYRFNVMATKDITLFRPYEAFDYKQRGNQ